ncbi:hypothetical protein CEXT_107511, partial [Caerostris extrusa]
MLYGQKAANSNRFIYGFFSIDLRNPTILAHRRLKPVRVQIVVLHHPQKRSPAQEHTLPRYP